MRPLGLRAQIMLALLGAFVVAFALLGFVAVQLAEDARARDRHAAADAAASSLAAAVDAHPDAPSAEIARLADPFVGRAGVSSIEIVRRGQATVVRGRPRGGHVSSASLAASTGTVRVYLRGPSARSAAPLTQALVLYFAVTCAAILLLTYVALTYLIVRPVEAVTRASERLASTGKQVRAPVRGAGEVARLAAAFNDMAEQLRKERSALEDRLRELERTTEELETTQQQLIRTEKLASVGRLAAGVAHEIGNPLAAILGLIELLRSTDVEPSDREELLKRIQRETERIHRIIRDLLDYSRGSAVVDDADASSDLREVVEDAVRLVSPQKDLRGVTIERRFADETPLVRGSSNRLTQIVLNLLLNAADAVGGNGAIRLEVGVGDDGFVSLVVADTGPGIAPDLRDRLFDPFVTSKRAGAGTGLGLAVCQSIVEGLGGTISASNPPEGGARLEVRLPPAPRS